MRCRGKTFQFAALLFALACNGASGAAVHRAQGVDAITAKLIGQQPVSSHVRPEGAEAPNQHFAPESWQPLYRELSARRTYEDKISQPTLEGGRQQYFPQPRAASLEVAAAASTPAAPTSSVPAATTTTTTASASTTTVTSTSAAPAMSTIKSNATASGDSKKRSPEVQDSIAAVASQLLNERPVMMDMRKPATAAPLVQQQQQAEPDKKWEKVVVTNAVPLKVSAQTDRPVTKVPPISEISTKMPATTTAKLAAMPTRFPPRKPAFATAASATEKMVEITTRKPSLATAAIKKPIMEILSTMRPSVVSTTEANKKTTILTDKKPVAVKNEATTTPRAATTTSVIRRPSSPMPITILKKNGTNTAVHFTTSRPAPITESIPGTPRTTVRPAVVKPAKPSSSAIFRQPSASVVTKAPAVVTTKRTPPRFEILATQKVPVVAATIKATTTTNAPTTTTSPTTTTTVAPETTTVKKSKKKPSKKTKKNKKRRRRPENKIGSEVEEKEEKPLTSRIYDYLSDIPSFGTTVVGLLMTAGLAGLFLLPIDGFARRSDQFKREEEVDGLVPSIIKAVYTSMNPGEPTHNDAFYEEQGPRRFKRQYRYEGVPYPSTTPGYRRRHPVYPMYKQANTNIMQLESNQMPFSLVRLIKQMLSVKLDVLSNVLRMASEQLRNYAQHAEIKKPTPVVTADPDEASTDESTTDLPRDDSTEEILLKAPTTTASPSTTETPVIKNTPLVEESDEANLIRRRTHD